MINTTVDVSLQDLALPNLRYIGGGVRIAENEQLCFVETVNWKSIVEKNSDILFERNNARGSFVLKS